MQTTLVPAGGAAVIELQLQVPGKYIFLDHAIERMKRGLMGWLIVDGPATPDIFNGTPIPGSATNQRYNEETRTSGSLRLVMSNSLAVSIRTSAGPMSSADRRMISPGASSLRWTSAALPPSQK